MPPALASGLTFAQATKNPPKRVSSQPSDILSVAIVAWSSSVILSDPSLQGMCVD